MIDKFESIIRGRELFESVKVTIQLGENTATGGKYYNLFPERDNKDFDWQQFQNYIKSDSDDVIHFPSIEEAKEFMYDYCDKIGLDKSLINFEIE